MIRPRWEFDGLYYYWNSTWDTKSEAQTRAKNIRARGKKARVMRVKMQIKQGKDIKSKTKYIVYERGK